MRFRTSRSASAHADDDCRGRAAVAGNITNARRHTGVSDRECDRWGDQPTELDGARGVDEVIRRPVIWELRTRIAAPAAIACVGAILEPASKIVDHIRHVLRQREVRRIGCGDAPKHARRVIAHCRGWVQPQGLRGFDQKIGQDRRIRCIPIERTRSDRRLSASLSAFDHHRKIVCGPFVNRCPVFGGVHR